MRPYPNYPMMDSLHTKTEQLVMEFQKSPYSEEIISTVTDHFREIRRACSNVEYQLDYQWGIVSYADGAILRNIIGTINNIHSLLTTASCPNDRLNLCFVVGLQLVCNLVVGNKKNQDIILMKYTNVLKKMFTYDGAKNYIYMIYYNCFLGSPHLEKLITSHTEAMVELTDVNLKSEFAELFIEVYMERCQYFDDFFEKFSVVQRANLLHMIRQRYLTEKDTKYSQCFVHFLGTKFKSYHQELLLQSFKSHDKAMAKEAATLLDILSNVSSNEIYLKVYQQDHELWQYTVDLFLQVCGVDEKQSGFNNIFVKTSSGSPLGKTHLFESILKNPAYIFKVNLVRLIANLSWHHNTGVVDHKSPLIQNLVECTKMIDTNNPFLQEWATFAVRNLRENNVSNRKQVDIYRRQGVISKAMMREVRQTSGSVAFSANRFCLPGYREPINSGLPIELRDMSKADCKRYLKHYFTGGDPELLAEMSNSSESSDCEKVVPAGGGCSGDTVSKTSSSNAVGHLHLYSSGGRGVPRHNPHHRGGASHGSAAAGGGGRRKFNSGRFANDRNRSTDFHKYSSSSDESCSCCETSNNTVPVSSECTPSSSQGMHAAGRRIRNTQNTFKESSGRRNVGAGREIGNETTASVGTGTSDAGVNGYRNARKMPPNQQQQRSPKHQYYPPKYRGGNYREGGKRMTTTTTTTNSAEAHVNSGARSQNASAPNSPSKVCRGRVKNDQPTKSEPCSRSQSNEKDDNHVEKEEAPLPASSKTGECLEGVVEEESTESRTATGESNAPLVGSSSPPSEEEEEKTSCCGGVVDDANDDDNGDSPVRVQDPPAHAETECPSQISSSPKNSGECSILDEIVSSLNLNDNEVKEKDNDVKSDDNSSPEPSSMSSTSASTTTATCAISREETKLQCQEQKPDQHSNQEEETKLQCQEQRPNQHSNQEEETKFQCLEQRPNQDSNDEETELQCQEQEPNQPNEEETKLQCEEKKPDLDSNEEEAKLQCQEQRPNQHSNEEETKLQFKEKKPDQDSNE